MSPNGVLNKSNSITEQTKKYSVNGKKKKVWFGVTQLTIYETGCAIVGTKVLVTVLSALRTSPPLPYQRGPCW